MAAGRAAAASNTLKESIVRHKQTNKDTGMLMLGYPCESIFEQKDHAAMVVLKTILSGYGYPGGWLHNELRGEGLVYFVAGHRDDRAGAGLFRGPLADPARQAGRGGRPHPREHGPGQGGPAFPADEFRAAIRQIVAMHAQENTTIAEQAQQAALDELYGLGYDYDKSFDAPHPGRHARRRDPRSPASTSTTASW